MARTHVTQQHDLLDMPLKITPPQTDCGEGSMLSILVGQLCLVGQFCLVWQVYLAMRSIGMQFRQLLLVGQLRLDVSSESASQGSYVAVLFLQRRPSSL